MKHIGIFLLCLVIIVGGFWIYFSMNYPMTSPLKSSEYFFEHLAQPHSKLTKYVFGFLPYWELDEIQYLKPNDLSEINYFSFSVGSDGHIIKVVNGQTDPGWNGWEKQTTRNFLTKAQIMGAKISITLAAQDNTTIESILNSNTAQQNIISDTVDLVKNNNLNGVNIDFEYTGTPDTLYQQEFTYFSKKLAQQLKQQNPNTELSLSIMPFSGPQTGLYDFPQLVSVYDHFIGMSYDYYAQNSSVAGPVAPMNGFKEGKYFFDVSSTYANFLNYLPKTKLLMGIPYYGWEWAVENGSTIDSSTFPSGNPNSYAALISYARSREDADLKPSQCQWDTYSEETWCWFTDKQTGVDHQAWIIDNRMIQTRLDYTNQQDFAGIAIWTLGLDKNYPDLWNEIDKTF